MCPLNCLLLHMPRIHFYPAEELPSHLAWQVRSFFRMRWTFLFRAQDRFRSGLWWTESLAPVHAVLVEDDILISHASIVRKQLKHAGETYTTLGLNGVFTFPDFRREGHGRRLVEAATHHIRHDSDADIGVLFCRSELMPFYGVVGWEHQSHAVTWVGEVDRPHQVETGLDTSEHRMMLFVSERAKQAQASFWDSPLYFGESEW